MNAAVYTAYFELACLTRTQYKTWEHLSSGKTLKETATCMNVSYRTAQNYLYALCDKLEVDQGNRADLTQLALAQHVVENKFVVTTW